MSPKLLPLQALLLSASTISKPLLPSSFSAVSTSRILTITAVAAAKAANICKIDEKKPE